MNQPEPKRQLASALGRIPSGVYILTVRHGDVETGMLCSWVQQCSFDPPQISLCIKRGRYVSDWLTEGTPFVLNILDSSATDMVIHFGKGFAEGVPAFNGVDIERRNGLPPILTDALAFLGCQVEGRIAAGDHDLIVGRVLSGQMLGDGQPMVHIRKNGMHY